MTDDPPRIPDDTARRAREMVTKLTAAVEREPTEFNIKALRGWLHDLKHPTKYAADTKGNKDDDD